MTAAALSAPPATRRHGPIMFRGEMVRPILAPLPADQKTQTRRRVRKDLALALDYFDCDDEHDAKVSYGEGHSGLGWYVSCGSYQEEGSSFLGQCPFGVPGDLLWVRETWALSGSMADYTKADIDRVERAPPAGDPRHVFGDNLVYRADGDGYDDATQHWRPSIFMPRWASRIDLELLDVRVQRLHDIDEADAAAEGVRGWSKTDEHGETISATAREEFEALWRRIHGPESWKANPWLWALTFKRVRPASITTAEK